MNTAELITAARELLSSDPYWTGPDYVECTVCGKRKKPYGRSIPLESVSDYCGVDDYCEGYMDSPEPGSLWPGEKREEFGYQGDASKSSNRNPGSTNSQLKARVKEWLRLETCQQTGVGELNMPTHWIVDMATEAVNLIDAQETFPERRYPENHDEIR